MTAPTYTQVRDGLHAVVATLSPTLIKTVLDYEPAGIDQYPLAYIILDDYRRRQAGQVTAMTYRFLVRVCVPIQASKEAEDLLIDTALQVADAIDTNPQFSGVLLSGLATSPDGKATWVMLGAKKCRAVDVFCEALSKFAYRGAL